MRPITIVLVMLLFLEGATQKSLPASQILFKQVSHPFMPSITSQYFYFTRDGLLWFSTANGLTSFDGSEVLYYSNEQESGKFLLNGITAIVEDANNNLYIGAGNKLCFYNRREKKFIPIEYSFADTKRPAELFINALFIDGNGDVYIACKYYGIFIYEPGTGKFGHISLISAKPDSWSDLRSNSAISFTQDSTDVSKLWVGTMKGIYLLNKTSKKLSQKFEVSNPAIYKYQPGLRVVFPDIQQMDMLNDSTIWFNSYTMGFGKYNTLTGTAKLFLHDARQKGDNWVGYVIRNFGKMDENRYLLGIADPHPGIFDARNEQFEFVNVSSPTNLFDRVRYVTNDKHGNVWVLNNGLLYVLVPNHYRLQRSLIQKFPVADGRYNSLYSLIFDNTKQVYVMGGRTVDGVHILDKDLMSKRIIPAPLMTNYFLRKVAVTDHVAIDKIGRYWATGLQTSIRLPEANKFELINKLFPSLEWLQKDEYTDILTNREGNLCLRRTGGKIVTIDYKSLQADSFSIPNFQPSSNYTITSSGMDYDSIAHWLFSSNGKGIARYDLLTNKSYAIPEISLFGNNTKQNAYAKFKLDHEGRLWILIEGYGIRILNCSSFDCIDSIPFGTKGLLKNDCTDIKYGGKDKMILKSRDGIIVYDYKQQRSSFFNSSNGYSYQSPTNYLYCNNYLVIGQAGHIEYYNLNDFERFNLNVRPILNTITADSTNVFTRSSNDSSVQLRLNWRQNNLSFSFSAIEFFFPERVEYAYQLEGFDKSWYYTNSRDRRINYTRLKPGSYTFKLRAQIEGGNWEGGAITCTIVVTPAFWQTTAFKGLVILCLLVGIYYAYRKRIVGIENKQQQVIRHEKQLMELEAMALRAQMNPHFIFNSLNSIKGLINKNQNEIAANYLTTFSKLIRTLFQNSDKREISLHEELETCKLYVELERMRFGNKTEFIFYIDESLDLKDIKVPALVIQPFIENAIWHGIVPKEKGGKVIITVNKNDGFIECVIDDDGIGRELSKQFKAKYKSSHQSKGIGLIQSRLELDKLLNGRQEFIQILDKQENNIATGTKVIISFKET